MSLEAMVWALKKAPVEDSLSHLVLIGLADHAAGDGAAAYPSIATLAEYARCSVRTVQARLRALEAQGLIVRGDQRLVLHLPGNRRPVVYDLNMALGVHDTHPKPGVHDGAGVHGQVVRGAQPGSPGVHAVADKPSLNHPEPSITSSPLAATALVVVADAFDDFWQAYPRKVGKAAAKRAFAKACQRTGQPHGVIVRGAQRLAADPNLPPVQYVPHPQTWLNRDGWEDAPYPVREGTRQEAEAALFDNAMERAVQREKAMGLR